MAATLDEMVDVVSSMHIPEGYRAEIIEGQIVVGPQRATHWAIIMHLTHTLLHTVGEDSPILSDVRIDFPGEGNAFAPDVALLAPGTEQDEAGRDYRAVRLVAEVVSRASRRNDYGPKLETYARAGVPCYLIADPLTRQVHVHQRPQEAEYADVRTYLFGNELVVDDPALRVDTSRWPADTEG